MSDTITKHAWRLATAMPHPRSVELGKAGLAAELSTLELGEKLELLVRIASRGASKSKVEIGLERSSRSDQMVHPDDKLTVGMRYASPAYDFETTPRALKTRKFKHTWKLSEGSAEKLNQPFGFRDSDREFHGARTVMWDQLAIQSECVGQVHTLWKSIDDVTAALMSTGAETEIRLTWRAILLPSKGSGGCPARAHGDPRPSKQDAVSDKTGLHLRARVSSDAVVPEALLKAIGRIALRFPDVDVSQSDQTEDGEAVCGERIRVLRRRNDLPPSILPSPEALIKAGTARRFPDPPANLPSKGTPIGIFPGQDRTGAVKIPDMERSRHVYVVGATGTGKSTMLLEMLRGDIRKGSGVLLVDPHGDLFEDALAMIPASRTDDLVVLDAANTESPFALNVLALPAMPKIHAATFITNELLAMFSSLYDMKNAGGPMFELYFTNAVSLLMTSGLAEPTLADLARVFEDPRFRRDCLETCKLPDTVRFWKQTAQRTSGDVSLENMGPYIFSKVNRFVQDSHLRPILAARQSGIDFRDAMDNNKIVLVNLAKGQIGAQSARFLGMVIMMRLLAATLGRANVPERDRKPFFVHVDEFQSLATESAGTFLAEARKFGVCMTLASQTLGQLEAGKSGLADTVTGNCGTMIMTRLGPADAGTLARTYGPDLTATEMQSLPSFHAVGRFLAREVPPPPFVFGVPKPRRSKRRNQMVVQTLQARLPGASTGEATEPLPLFSEAGEMPTPPEVGGADLRKKAA